MFQALTYISGGRVIVLRDGSVAGYGQPEPKFLQRRYEHAQALREMRREPRAGKAPTDEPTGFVERIRSALGIA